MPNDQVTVQRIATKAIVVNDQNKILLLREAVTYEEGTNIGRYHLPGGRLEMGESFPDGLKREVREEAGLDITVGKPVYVGEWRPVIKGVATQIVAIFFVCQALSADVVLSAEHDEAIWIDPADAANYDVMEPEPEAIKAYIESQKN